MCVRQTRDVVTSSFDSMFSRPDQDVLPVVVLHLKCTADTTALQMKNTRGIKKFEERALRCKKKNNRRQDQLESMQKVLPANTV